MAFQQHIDIVKEYCPEADIIFDVGACLGAFSKQFLKWWPKARVYAFEPNPECVEVLRRDKDRRLTVVDKGVGGIDDDGVVLNVNRRDPSIGTFMEPHERLGRFEQISARMIRLDSFCEHMGINKIDILKVDAQGLELSVLWSAGDLLKTTQVVVIELMFYQYAHGSDLWWKIPETLHHFGLDLHWILPTYRKLDGVNRIGFADAIFRRVDE